MGIRQKLNDKPLMAIGVAAIVIVAAAIVVIRTSCVDDGGDGSDPRSGPPDMQFFTTDDGPNPQTFVDDATKVPPFSSNGKLASRARVYRCRHGKQFVAYLERFNDTDRKQLQDAIDQAKAKGEHLPSPDSFRNRIEVKRPGDTDWVRLTNATNERYQAIVTPVCPEGSHEGLEQVTPE